MPLNFSRWSFREYCLFGSALCAWLICFAYTSELIWSLNPCPLCMFQRVAFAALGAVLFVAGIWAPEGRAGRAVLGGLALIPALAGMGVATRHVWITHLPADKVPECGPPLAFMMEANPLADVIKKVLTGSGECAKVDWTFLGLSMPAWSLLWFVLLTLLVLTAAFRRR